MKKLTLLGSISCLALLSAFDNGTPGWKLDAEGKMVLKDGNPIYVNSAGQEQTVEAGTITRLNGEAKEFRIAKEKAEEQLQKFAGLDPDKAKAAIETVDKLDKKRLIDSGEVDKLQNQIKEQFTTQLNEKDSALSTLQSRLDNMVVGDVFKSSEFVRDGIAVPRDMFEATFRNNFKIEDGKVVAYGKDGNRLLSKTRAGEFADPEEALQILVEQHPQKEVIMKANTGNGTGNQGGGGNRGGGRTIARADFEKLSPSQQAETAGKVRAGEMKLTE